jgi:hypothetical protein
LTGGWAGGTGDGSLPVGLGVFSLLMVIRVFQASLVDSLRCKLKEHEK